jgi:acetyl-CoA carboxylase carboxyl transferase subunit alpha
MGDNIQKLERKIEELRELSQRDGIDLSEEIARLEAKLEALRTPPKKPGDWERVQLARHPKRPTTLDYLERIMEDYYELRGDRLYGDDPALVSALARFEGRTVVAIGHQKGHTAEENRVRNFGMPHPEGYRKALRTMKLAERFGFPIFSFIDTPGAYPGIGAEERNIGGALAQNIYEMFKLRVPIVVAIIGEGGSGGALGIGVGDRVLMMENSIYSVISPEGCAAILWRDRDKAPEAARALKLTAHHLFEFGVIDEIIPEPPGGAQTDYEGAAQALKEALSRHLEEIEALKTEKMLKLRYQKFQEIGLYEELTEVVEPPAGSRRR